MNYVKIEGFNMSEIKKVITERDFKKIFSNEKICDLLLTKNVCYPLIYYFMKYFISWRVYIKNEPPCKESISFQKSISVSWFVFKSILKNVEKTKGNLDILFISRNRFFDLKTSECMQYKSDYLFGNVIHFMKKKHPNYKTLFISTSPENTPEINDIKLRSLLEYGSFIILLKSFIQSSKVYIKWQLYTTTIINDLVKNNLDYITPLFLNFFSFKTLFYNYFFDYCLHNIINSTKPKLILANDDIMSLKPLTSFDTNLVVMQSASMDVNNEQSRKMFISSFFTEIKKSDFFLVTGQKYYEIKKDTNDSKKIIVTGQPRYDILHYSDKIYNKEIFLEKYKISPYHKIILWTTQCHGMSDEENKKNMRTVFSSIEKLNDITLIIKQHPDEGIIYTRMITEYLSKYSINATIAPTNSDIYELLYFCNLMITKNSTTTIEALALNKPVIVLNLGDEPDVMDYVKKGVALGVYKEDELKISIETMIKNDLDLTKNRESYIYESLYRIDGRSSERVVEFIEAILK